MSDFDDFITKTESPNSTDFDSFMKSGPSDSANDFEDFMNNQNSFDRRKRTRSSNPKAQAVYNAGRALGVDPLDLATTISYETAGTFDPWQPGPVTKWGQHRGTIQFGEPQAKQYGVYKGQTFEEQVEGPVVKYLKDRGVRPGMNITQIYKAINGGNVNVSGRASDGYGTIDTHVQKMLGDHRRKAQVFLGGDIELSAQSYTPQVVDIPLTKIKIGEAISNSYSTPSNESDIMPITKDWSSFQPILKNDIQLQQENADLEAVINKSAQIGQTNFNTNPPVVSSVAPPTVNQPQTQTLPDGSDLQKNYQTYLEASGQADSQKAREEYNQILKTETDRTNSINQVQPPVSQPVATQNVAQPEKRAPAIPAAGQLLPRSISEQANDDRDILSASAGNVTIDLRRKPKGENPGNYILRTALTQVAPQYGMTQQEIESYLTSGNAPAVDYYNDLNDDQYERAIQNLISRKQNAQVDFAVRNQIVNDILNRRQGGDSSNLNADLVNKDLRAETAFQSAMTDKGLEQSQSNSEYFRQKTEFAQVKRKLETERSADPFNQNSVTDDEVSKRLTRDQSNQEQAKTDIDFWREKFGDTVADGFAAYLGSSARAYRGLAGIVRPLSALGINSPYEKLGDVAAAGEAVDQEAFKNTGTLGQIYRTAIGLPTDLARLGLLSRLPGGAVVGFAADAGLQSAGVGDSVAEIVKQTTKGGALGATFSVAGKVGGAVKSVAPAFSTVAKLGTIGGSTFAVEKLFGASNEEALQSAILNTVFDAAQSYGTKIFGKVGRIWNKGKASDVAVDHSGNVSLVKFDSAANPNRVDFELVLDPTDGVYKESAEVGNNRGKIIGGDQKIDDFDAMQTGNIPSNDVSVSQMEINDASAAESNINRGRSIENNNSAPRELAAENPRRIEVAQPEAVKRAQIDTRTQKIADKLKGKDSVSVDELQKATRYNKTNVEEAILTLFAAKQVEILPNSRVRMIGGENSPSKPKSLFEKAGEFQSSAQPIEPKKSTTEGDTLSAPKTEGEFALPVEKAVIPEKVDYLGENNRDLAENTKTAYENIPPQKAEEKKTAKPVAQISFAERPNTAKKLNVFTERGTKASIEPKVIDSSQILTSLDEGYPQEFQPRDRTRAASKAQISEIAGNLNPDFLGDSPKASDGRPIVAVVKMPDGQTKYAVISGTGRSEAIRTAYNSNSEQSQKYAEFAKSKDFQTTARQPVYVGVLDPQEISDLPSFAKEANESATALMSASEQAKADAERLDAGVLNLFVPSDDGSLHAAANRDFTRAFVAKVAATSEHGRLVDAEGKLSQDGAARVRNALFAKAFGDSEAGLNAISRMAESTDNAVKNITNGLLAKSGALAAYKESAKAGTRRAQYNIAGDFARSMEKYAALKDSGMSVEDYIKQGNLFGAETSPLQTRIMQVFDTHKRSPKAVRSIVDNFLRAADALGDPNQRDLFGENEIPDVESVFEGAVRDYENTTGNQTEQIGLFGQDQQREIKPGARPQGHGTAQEIERNFQELDLPVSPKPVSAAPERRKINRDERGKYGQFWHTLIKEGSSKERAQTAFLNAVPIRRAVGLDKSATPAQVSDAIKKDIYDKGLADFRDESTDSTRTDVSPAQVSKWLDDLNAPYAKNILNRAIRETKEKTAEKLFLEPDAIRDRELEDILDEYVANRPAIERLNALGKTKKFNQALEEFAASGNKTDFGKFLVKEGINPFYATRYIEYIREAASDIIQGRTVASAQAGDGKTGDGSRRAADRQTDQIAGESSNEQSERTEPILKLTQNRANTKSQRAAAKTETIKLARTAKILSRDGYRLELNAEGNELLHRVITFSETGDGLFSKTPQFISGAFMDSSQIAIVSEVLRKFAKLSVSGNYGYSPEDVAGVIEIADGLEETAREHQQAVIPYLFDEALPHEEGHRASFVGSGGTSLDNRHKDLARLTNLDSFKKSAETLSESYPRAKPPELVEETFAWIIGGEREELGLTASEADNYLKEWFLSYTETHGINSLDAFDAEKFALETEYVEQLINRSRESVHGADGRKTQRRDQPESQLTGGSRNISVGRTGRRNDGIYENDAAVQRPAGRTGAANQQVPRRAGSYPPQIKEAEPENSSRSVKLINQIKYQDLKSAAERALYKSVDNVKDANLSDWDLIKFAKTEIKDGILYVNNRAAELIRRGLVASGDLPDDTYFYGAYIEPGGADGAIKYIDKFIQTLPVNLQKRAEKTVNNLIDAIDLDYQDVTIVLNSAHLPEGFEQARQEEKLHRADFRTRDFKPLDSSRFLANPAVDAVKSTVESQGYTGLSDDELAAEIIAKALTDDAESELGVSESDLAEILDSYWNELLKTGKTPADVKAHFSGINQRAEEFTQDVFEFQRINGQTNSRSGVKISNPGGSKTKILRQPALRADARKPFAERDSDEFRKLRRADILGKIRRGDQESENGQSSRGLVKPSKVHLAKQPSAEPSALGRAIEKVKNVAIDVISVPKSLKSSFDLSAPLRQGAVFTLTEPSIASRAFVRMLKSLNKDQYEKFIRDLNLHPSIELAEASGLYLSNLANQSELNEREEAFMSRIFGNEEFLSNKAAEVTRLFLTYPFRKSEATYSTYLDVVRIDAFTKYAKEIHEYNQSKGKPDDIEQFKSIASFVNNATGRGTLGNFEDAAPILNAIFFSPRYLTSRLQLMNPAFYGKLSPGARKIAVRKMIEFAGASGSILALFALAGAKIVLDDPDSPDFLKIKFGDYRYDVGAGFIQPARYLARLIIAAKNRATGKNKKGFGEAKELVITKQFLRSKFSPSIGSGINIYSGKNFVGEKADLKSEALDLVSPLMIDEFYEASKTDGAKGAIKVLPSFFGVGVSRYKSKR